MMDVLPFNVTQRTLNEGIVINLGCLQWNPFFI
jgi:hypothetical protein